ncbi:amidase [Demequina zhanjiangensis]|uniref:amidase n=1 Tax=Demequina zhanjiangensis TaxID=3051659 RepID=UPI00345E1FBD
MKAFDIVEMGLPEMRAALEAGEVTSVDLVVAYLNRIAYYDRTGPCLHALAVLNPDVLADAAASDARRARGEAGLLEGIPFTIKDSYKAKGLTVASGSPALKDLVATDDAASVALLKEAGAVLIGKTNMPPMAAGGIQPGVYDYARSPYNPDYITAAYGSGSSNGSGTSTAASMAAFGMAEETVSSGRSPASNNALVAYTPSRGLISIRGNWPLRPTCDVVVPHTRTVSDLMILLDVLIAEDPDTTGDFWRQQTAVELPKPESVVSKPMLRERPTRLDGLRIGVPRIFIGEDDAPLEPPVIRPSVRKLWDQAADDLRALGAEVIEVSFPAWENYEEDRPGAQGLAARGLVPANWRTMEGGPVTAMVLDQFLQVNGDPNLRSWADVDGDSVFPVEDALWPVWITRARGGFDWQRLAEMAKAGVPSSFDEVPGFDQLLTGLEQARKDDFEAWLVSEGLDFIVFPAAGDVGRDDLFTRPESLADASRNGVVYSNGNRVIRHLGIPTVTVPMGFMGDTQMPVGLTFAGPAYSDDVLIDRAYAYEQATARRLPAFLTPSLPSDVIPAGSGGTKDAPGTTAHAVEIVKGDAFWEVTVRVDGGADGTQVWADGHILAPVDGEPGAFSGRISLRRHRLFDEVFVLVKAGRGAGEYSLAPLPA